MIKGHLDVNLEQAACYEDMAYSDSELYLKEIYPYLDEFQNKDIVYKFGDDERRLSKKELACLIKCDENKIPVLDDNASLIIDKDAVKNLIQNIGDEFNTYCNHYFTTHNGDSVYIDTGNYGNEINAKTEIEWLYEFLTKEDNVIIHEPEYLHTANYLGKNDIGDTYIEVSISEQKMFYFKDGEMILSTDVVTGNAGRKRDTPQKVCFVYGKQEKRVLRGPGYASFVNFWMPVSGNIGIHDSPWRSEYGGEIYKTNGSHGCINTPYNVMKELYEAVEIGTPVIIYDTNNTN